MRRLLCAAHMDALQAIVLGIVQGLTEFLPISSSAHLRIVSAFFGWDDPGAAYTAVDPDRDRGRGAHLLPQRPVGDPQHLAAGAARSVAARRPDTKMGWFIIVATIPIGLIGFALKDQIESGARDLYLIGTTLIVFALILHWADRARAAGARDRRPVDARRRSSSALPSRSRWCRACRARARR